MGTYGESPSFLDHLLSVFLEGLFLAMWAGTGRPRAPAIGRPLAVTSEPRIGDHQGTLGSPWERSRGWRFGPGGCLPARGHAPHDMAQMPQGER